MLLIATIVTSELFVGWIFGLFQRRYTIIRRGIPFVFAFNMEKSLSRTWCARVAGRRHIMPQSVSKDFGSVVLKLCTFLQLSFFPRKQDAFGETKSVISFMKLGPFETWRLASWFTKSLIGPMINLLCALHPTSLYLSCQIYQENDKQRPHVEE